MCRYVRTMAGVIRVFAAHLILQSTLSNTLGLEALSGARGRSTFEWFDCACRKDRYLVDPASSHMLVSKIKPCMSKYKRLYCETANGSLNQQ